MPLLVDLHREHVEDFLRSMYDRGNKPATVRNRYASLFQFYNWALDADVRKIHRMARIKAPLVPQQVQPDYTPEEVSRLLAAIPSRTINDLRGRAIVSLLYATGVRCQELCDIAVSDVDREAQRIVIRAGKSGRGRKVGYSHATANAVNRYMRNVDGQGPARSHGLVARQCRESNHELNRWSRALRSDRSRQHHQRVQ